MKCKTGVVFLFLFARPIDSPAIDWGIKAGVHLAEFGLSPSHESSWKIFLHCQLSVFSRHPITKRISFQPEVHFIQKGGCNESTQGSDSFLLRYTFNYVEVPLLVRLDYPLAKKWSVGIAAGFFADFRLSARQELIVNGTSWKDDIRDDIRGFDVGFLFGGEVGFALGKGRIFIETRYQQGINSVLKNPSQTKIFNRGISFLFGYMF